MSFDIKYDKDGRPVQNQQLAQELSTQADQVEQPVSEVPEQELSSDDSLTETLASADQEPKIAPQPPEAPKETAAAKSFRELRQKTERLERERDEALRYAQQLAEKQQAKQAEAPQDEEINLADEDLAEGKHLRKMTNKMKALENKLKEYERSTSEATIELKLKSQYPDFDKIVSRENIDLLRETFPELAATINSSNSDLYTKGVTAYTMIKKLGIHQEPEVTYEQQAVQRNIAKPRPVSSLSPQQGESPLTKANAFAHGLTEELKAQLRKEMDAARKGY